MSDTPTLQFHKQAMLSGPTLLLRPIWALEFGLAAGLVFTQLVFRVNSSSLQHEGEPAFRSSYTKLQCQFPFYTERWIIEIVRRLESVGAIEVIHTGRVNVFVIGDYEFKVKPTPQNDAAMLVFPGLACRVGLMEAVALQQIHLRHYHSDGSYWAIRSLSRWHSDSFMFLGSATVQRLFARLREQELIFVRSYPDDAGPVHSYRVNYVRVAEVLGLPVPTFQIPDGVKGKDWVDPFHPFQKVSDSVGSNVISILH